MAGDLEVALKIRADIGAARRDIAGLRSDVQRLGAAGGTAAQGLGQTTRQLEGMRNVSSGLASSIKLLGGALAGLGAVRAFGAIIKATTEQEAALAQIEARIKSTGGAAGVTTQQLADMAGELQSATTFADDQINAMQAVLLTFTNITGDTFGQATTAILDMATAMGQDLKSTAVQVGKALNDPIQGAQTLRRVGVQLTDSQEELIKRLVETGRLAEAQGVILKELSVEFGGAAMAARNTFGGALEGLKNAASDLLEAHGGLPGARVEIEKLTSALSDPEFQRSADYVMSTLVGGFADMLKSLPEVVRQVRELAPLIGAVSGAIAAGRTGTLIGSVFGPYAASATGIIGAIYGGVKGFQAGSAIQNPPPPPEAPPGAPPPAQGLTAEQRAAAAAARAAEAAAAANRKAAADAADQAAKQAEAAEKRRIESINGIVQALQEEIDTYGMSAEQIQIYKLEQLGASDATIQQATALSGIIQAKRDEEATLKATRAAIEAEAKARREAQQADEEYILTIGNEIRMLSLSARERAQDEAVRQLSVEATAEQIAAVRELSGALFDQQQVATETGDAMSEFAIQAARNMQSAFADFLFDPFQGGLMGMAENFTNVLRQMASEALAANIFEAIGAEGALKGLLTLGSGAEEAAAAQQAAAAAAAAALTTGGATAGTAITTGGATAGATLTASGTATAASIVAGAQTAAAILSAAGASGSTGGVGGLLSGLFHSGGVVGGAAGAVRSMPAITFAGAPRLHAGGIAGLAADEMPAILRRNEEVLTRDDPRHRYNGGGGQQQPVTIKNINLFDTQAIGDYLATAEGEKVVLNIVSRNRSTLGGG